MPLTAEDRNFVRDLYRKFVDQALEPEDPFREPIHEKANEDDPVEIMQSRIELADVQTMQLFSGFSGAGKTTELFRLRRNLREQGYIVLYADALKYVDPFHPLPIADMLMVLAGAFSDAIAEDPDLTPPRESFWDRLRSFVERTEVRLSSADGKLEYTSPAHSVIGGIKAGLSIKAELKTGSSFRRQLQDFLASHLVQVQAEVQRFFEDGAKAIWAAKGSEDVPIVFILDQLEQMRGDYHNWQDVIRCVQQLFTVHLDRLRMPYVHCVYSVPAWLAFLNRPPEMTLLPTVRLWNNDAARTPYEDGLTMFRSLMRRRISAEAACRLLGPDHGDAIDDLIAACGGQVRDLLRMMREVLTRARATTLPVDRRVVERVINVTRRDFSVIAEDDARLLHDIASKRKLELETLNEHAIERLSNFFNTHFVMYFENGSSWYDIHPLIREEVQRIATDTGQPG